MFKIVRERKKAQVTGGGIVENASFVRETSMHINVLKRICSFITNGISE
jgi:hypothetical protein